MQFIIKSYVYALILCIVILLGEKKEQLQKLTKSIWQFIFFMIRPSKLGENNYPFIDKQYPTKVL